MKNVFEQVDSNKRKSAVVVAVFAAVVAVSVYFLAMGMAAYAGGSGRIGDIGGIGMIGVALIISGVMSFGGYWFSDRIVLGLSGARPADKKRDFQLFTVTENLSMAAGLPMPKLYVIDDSAPNAFATGRDPKHAAICATTGLLAKLDRTELEGVIAHELSHVGNYDTRLLSVVTVLAGVVVLMGDWFLRMSWYGRGGRGDQGDRGDRGMGAIFIAIGLIFAILSPIVAQLIQLAISRKRELLADASGVKLTRQPDGLARALVKISGDREPLEAANKATAHLYIMNPLKNRHDAIGWFAGMFNTHPPLKERIDQLRLMGAGI
ncbi:MAG: Protease HtpX-like protein [Candidatus Gottesmanbacteria bacterium GW2011_GWA2_44_17]|uniref:Protease HtpX homolog n=1 Tax=Candidatus Gottesmanbacteria bacterium GW2011_GWA2_44_17 TaxID=1618444 RepID=A0A0G1KEB8_9BACT|nr:MAG: Protease HtpX-like protein [Candidatus Gottesmanbacteria bacterium GW2011_GWA2_44_17]